MEVVVSRGIAEFEPLEPRRLFSLSWGPVATLIHQNQSTQQFPNVTGSGEVIVDIDSGIDFSHPTLAGRIWSNPGETPNDGVDNDGNGFVDDLQGWNFYDGNNDATDDLGHGTQTSGIMVGNLWRYTTDGHDYEGIAPDAQVLPLKISTPPDPSTTFDQHVGQALSYVLWMVQHHPEYHIVAVNLSLAAVSEASYDQYEKPQIDALYNLGVFIAAAAGNESNPSAVDFPANDPDVFAIAGVNPNGTLTPGSNRGAKVALVAPGNQVPVLNKGNTYFTSGDGTSYATPYATAAAALIKQVNPSFTPTQVMGILQRSGTDTYDRTSHRTYRILNLDAAIALAYAQSGTQSTPFLGVAASAPGVIQAENFDQGGEGVAYHDTDAVNEGHRYRTGEGIDEERCYEGGYDVTNNYAGEYLKYTVNVTAGGTYNVDFRVAARKLGGTFHLEVDGLDVTGPLVVPRTGSAQTYTTLVKSGIALTYGVHQLKLVFDANSASGSVGNFNWIQIVAPGRATAAVAEPALAVQAATPFAVEETKRKNWLAS